MNGFIKLSMRHYGMKRTSKLIGLLCSKPIIGFSSRCF